MKTLYIESSAILAWLLGEPKANLVIKAIDSAEVVVSSVLSILETERALIRAEKQNQISEADAQRLLGLFSNTMLDWAFLEITETVRRRAALPFPVEPVRSLDGIHLASMLEFLQVYPKMEILTFDHRIIENIRPLGLTLV